MQPTGIRPGNVIAYFSMEVGIEESIPTSMEK
jgi:hypothetical protein